MGCTDKLKGDGKDIGKSPGAGKLVYSSAHVKDQQVLGRGKKELENTYSGCN